MDGCKESHFHALMCLMLFHTLYFCFDDELYILNVLYQVLPSAPIN